MQIHYNRNPTGVGSDLWGRAGHNFRLFPHFLQSGRLCCAHSCVMKGMDEKDRRGPKQNSQAYIVRLWRRGKDGHWCGSVQDVASGERQGFATLEEVLAHIREQAGSAGDSSQRPSAGSGRGEREK